LTKRVLIPYRHANKLAAYQEAVRASGLEPVPALASSSISLENAAGLLLMGGTDVNPGLYGEMPAPETDVPDEERDRAELAAIEEAYGRDLPILAICRGLQILNVYHGGTLIQHLSSERHDPETPDPAQPAHDIQIQERSLLADIAGTTHWKVNSRHHQAVCKIGPGLRVTACDPEDQTIEALERPDKEFVLAVQWHPEDQVRQDSNQWKLFQRFAAACRATALAR
jgi:putative glutamine amidotransferase